MELVEKVSSTSRWQRWRAQLGKLGELRQDLLDKTDVELPGRKREKLRT